MKKLFALLLLLAAVATSGVVTKLKEKTVEVFGVRRDVKTSITYLLCGYDDAAENTDSIVLASYSYVNNTMSFLQI